MLHFQTLEKPSYDLLNDMMEGKTLEQAGFVLVGGTALALQVGHRMSTDIDLFTDKPFKPLALKQDLIDTYKDRVDVYSVTGNGLRAFIDGVKVDMVYFHYPNPFPIVKQDNIRMLSLDSLAAMKIHAVGNRGLRRDFVDLAELLQKKPLNELMASYQQQFNSSPAAMAHLKRGLTYFGDAEASPQPMDIHNGRKWEQVKQIVVKSVQNPNAIQYMKAPKEIVARNPYAPKIAKAAGVKLDKKALSQNSKTTVPKAGSKQSELRRGGDLETETKKSSVQQTVTAKNSTPPPINTNRPPAEKKQTSSQTPDKPNLVRQTTPKHEPPKAAVKMRR